MHTCFLQCDTPQIQSRIFHELTEKKLLTNDNTPSSSLNQKPSTNAKSNSYLSSDSDFEDRSAVIRKRKKQISNSSKFESDGNSSESGFTNFASPKSLNWEQLPADIQSVLPHDEEYSYIIQSYQNKETRSFEGAPEFAFSAVIRINLESTEAVDNWLKKMMETSLCTYRVSRGGHKPVGKLILCKHEMHCQHSRKALTPKQIQKSAAAKAKKLRKPLCTLVRDKKTQCPSTLTLSLQVPTKKQKRAAEQHPYLLSHRAVSWISSTTILFMLLILSVKTQSSNSLSILTKSIVPHLQGTHMNKCSFSTQKQMLTNKQC